MFLPYLYDLRGADYLNVYQTQGLARERGVRPLADGPTGSGVDAGIPQTVKNSHRVADAKRFIQS